MRWPSGWRLLCQVFHVLLLDRQVASLKVDSRVRLVASANSPTVVEFIVELIGELFIVELFYCNYLEFLKACFKIIHYKNT